MKFQISRYSPSLAAGLRRVAVVASLLGLGAASLAPGAQAQAPPNDTAVPLPYSWPGFHAGGTLPAPLPIPPLVPTPNLLSGQLQGTPTGVFKSGANTFVTEIPSFLLGNYDPNIAPLPAALSPNNFRDALPFDILSWSSPFTFTYPTAATANVAALVQDDTLDGAADNPNVVLTPMRAEWQDGATPPGPFPDGTATNSEYLRHAAVVGTNVAATATWTLTVPADAPPLIGSGFYAVTFHIPDAIGVSATGGTTSGELRVPDAHYVVKDFASGTVLADVRVSQTETNANQFLAGPFFLKSGQVLTVRLDNTTLALTDATNHFVVADSVSLQPGFGSDVRSAPTAINASEYPEITNALYYGVQARTISDADPNPRGNVTIVNPPSADPALSTSFDDGAVMGKEHMIRQLVYFGRAENIVLQNSSGDLVDDKGASVSSPIVRSVGAIYCVDGSSGSVVWRYQTPAVYATDVKHAIITDTAGNPVVQSGSAPVFSTPAVARINVVTQVTAGTPGNPPTRSYATKLVVIVGDSNGLVYCLDAVGHRDGTANAFAVSPNGQVIFNPQAPRTYHTDGKQDVAPKPHAGNTHAYWIYRPDPEQPKDNTGAVVRADLTRDLPVPLSFGLASPTVYVNPAITKTIAVGAAPNDPGTSDASQFPDNSRVYIGNSNGVLYALKGQGGVDPAALQFNNSRPIGDMTASDTATGSFSVPTCDPLWWFPINGSASNTEDLDNNNYKITSTPALLTPTAAAAAASTTSPLNKTPPDGYVYVTSANDTLNEGRLYAIRAELGPGDSSGKGKVPGDVGFNDVAVPLWAFPQVALGSAYGGGAATRTADRPPLGSMTGSPVVFINPDDKDTAGKPKARVYVAASSGVEEANQDRPGVEETGRIWAVEAQDYIGGGPVLGTPIPGGTFALAYPSAQDPNVSDSAQDGTDATSPPVGAFRFATPAVGLVQFPASVQGGDGTPYDHTDRTSGGLSVLSRAVPMLYVGSAGVLPGRYAPRFFGIDLDGVNDDERTIFQETVTTGAAPATTTTTTPGIPSPGAAFQSSPALIVNATTNTAAGKGNGGALFVGAGSTLYQISATPVTNLTPATKDPAFPVLPLIVGAGLISPPAVAGYDTHDLSTDAGTIAGVDARVNNVTDWLYFCDSGLGICEGITPRFQNGGVGTALENNILPRNPIPPQIVLPQFPLYSYLFDGTAPHPGGKDVPVGATDTQARDMNNANAIGGPLSIFEWGQNVYIRIGNVVPPPVVGGRPLGHTYNPTADALPPDNLISYPDDPTIFFTNGGPVSIQISEYDPASRQANQTDSGQVPTTILKPSDPLGAYLPGNGFVARADAVQGSGSSAHFLTHLNERLIDARGNGWIAAYTYAIRDGSGRKNTPGSTRRVINATQTATAYRVVTPPMGPPTVEFLQSVTLTTTITQGGQYTRGFDRVTRRPTAIAPIDRVDQPTFALLNPLAEHGGGVPILGGNGAPKQIGDVVGPFAGVNKPGSATPDDLPAYTNGNRTYRDPSDIPKSGVLGNGQPSARLRGHRVVTATGEINHGTTGDNATPNAPPFAPTGKKGQGTGGLIDINLFGEYMLNIADRSVLGLSGQHLQVTMEAHNAHWNDNTRTGGPGAVVNPLPWERMPAQFGPNTTPDYPNIPRRNVTHVIQPNNPNAASGIGGPATNQAVVPNPATANGADPADRIVYADPVQVKVDVPRYQPANLQLYEDQGRGGIPPDVANKNNITYPMGYVSRRQRVYVDSNHNGRYDDGEAYRYLFTYVGVPVDMNTTIETSTIDLGKLPQSLGVQTDLFAPLDTFMPYTLPLSGSYPARFRNFFKPLDIRNRGNVNLLNVHLDQKIITPDIPGVLPLVSDALDSQAFIPAYDSRGITGPRPPGVQPFLLRSSLDTDLVAAFGRNPGIRNDATLNGLYPSATFHKAQVGAGQPPALTVPDVPSNNHPDFAGVGFNLASTGGAPPLVSSGALVNSAGKPATSVPYIGLAVPLGTPVGTYSQRVQLFEGIDPAGYTDIGQTTAAGGSFLYTPLLPPKYGTQRITVGAAATAPGPLDDTWRATIVRTGSTPTVVKGTVMEARVTDGTSFGTLPQIDPARADFLTAGNSAKGVADFQPSAFRNIAWDGPKLLGDGSLGLVWTTSRGYTSATAPQYNIAGALLSYQGGYFNSTPNGFADPMSRWWKLPAISGSNTNGLLFTNTVASSGVNTGMTLAKDQHRLTSSGDFSSDGTAYAFVQNVAAGAGYQSQILCYPVVGGVVDTRPASAISVSRDPGPAKSGVRGLKFSGATFSDPFGAAGTIKNNLWAFWGGGARGRSTISFSSADTTAGTGGLTFGKSAVLPVPAGLVSVSDPNAVLIYVPKGATTEPIPAIEVTYTGVSPDNNADIYVSRYLPYYVRDAQNKQTSQIGLSLVPSPLITEQLQVGAGNLYWQARDVAWLRSGTLNVTVGSGPDSSLLLDPANGNLRTGVKQTFDRATGSLVYTNVAVPVTNSTTVNSTVYLDLARGRVRFSPALTGSQAVTATFFSQARRITTDTRADTAPLAFLDPTFKPNEAPGTNDRIQTDRYWFIWRKSGSSGTSTTPTLFYKTQRLTLVLHDNANNPISLQMGAKTGLPTRLTITDVNGGPAVANTDVDIDWARGRLYFPMLLKGTTTTEGRTYQITFTASDGKTYTVTDTLKWLDEPRNNDLQNQPTTGGPLSAAATTESVIPIDTITNESNVSAFLDPLAYANVQGGAYDPFGGSGTNHADQPRKIWLFWNSTRNGTADLYYETIQPRFSAIPGR